MLIVVPGVGAVAVAVMVGAVAVVVVVVVVVEVGIGVEIVVKLVKVVGGSVEETQILKCCFIVPLESQISQ